MGLKSVVAADLFCGGGGTSTGFAGACRELERPAQLTAINCWPEAIEVHKANHPWARHVCQRIEAIRPEDLFPEADPDGLLASPECTWHSTARGGKPINDQLRSSPWVIPRWLDAFDLDWFIIENVPGFANWGRLDPKGRPVKKLSGQIFKTYDQALRSYGYNGEWRVLNSADYGAFTTRSRLFGLFRRGVNKPIYWPRPTHSRHAKQPGTRPWRSAREILDFSLPTRSIFQPPYLAENTLRRIAAGAMKRWGINIEPFIVHLTHGGREHDLDAPVPTVTAANRGELGVVEPFLLDTYGSKDQYPSRVIGLDQPIGAVTGSNRFASVEPLILGQGGGSTARPAIEPLPTHHGDGHIRLLQPLILPPEGFYRGNQPRGTDEPLPTITQRGDQLRYIEPVVLSVDRPITNRSLPMPVSEPMGTITGNPRLGLLEPFLVPNKSERDGQAPRHTGIDEPLNTVTATGNTGNVIQPLLVGYNGNGHTHPVHDPVPTLTTKHRVGLAIPVLLGDGRRAYLDIRFRMLHWRELAAAMGFPRDYKFLEDRMTKTSIVKMIGNAVETNMAKALALTQIRGRPMDVPQVQLPGVAA